MLICVNLVCFKNFHLKLTVDDLIGMRESALFTLSVLLKNNVDNQNKVRELGDTPIGVLDTEGVLKPFPEKNIIQI